MLPPLQRRVQTALQGSLTFDFNIIDYAGNTTQQLMRLQMLQLMEAAGMG